MDIDMQGHVSILCIHGHIHVSVLLVVTFACDNYTQLSVFINAEI